MIKDPALNRIALRLAGSRIRTAGRIEFVRDQGPLRRDIRVQGFRWDPEIHRNLAKTLWAVERSHSYSMAALRLFSKMNSSEFSPDGLLGGRGYIQQVKEMRSNLSQAVEVLSSFSDTLHDEVNADHWRAAMEDPTTSDIVERAEDIKQNPEGYVEQAFQQEVPTASEEFDPSSMNPSPDDFNPFESPEPDESGGEGEDDDEDEQWGWSSTSSDSKEVPLPGPKSGLPTDGGEQETGAKPVEALMNTTGEAPRGNYAAAIGRIVDGWRARVAAHRIVGDPVRVADSSVDPATLPGPRVMHIGPGESPEEFGYETADGDRPSDDPLGEGFSHLDRVYEDEAADGVTGYSDPTKGDETVFKLSSMASRLGATYSWLPGSRNEKLMPYYDRGVTEDDAAWMRAHDAPDPPAGMRPDPIRPQTDPLWEVRREYAQPSPD